jgi:hypothetical protein
VAVPVCVDRSVNPAAASPCQSPTRTLSIDEPARSSAPMAEVIGSVTAMIRPTSPLASCR